MSIAALVRAREPVPMQVPSALPRYAADASISYACERCKTERSLPPARQLPGRLDRLRVRAAVFGRRGGDRESRRRFVAQLNQEYLTRAEEAAYVKFTGSFRFCHECRRFVCPRCWNITWRTCKSCVARAMKNMSPRRRRFHYGLSVTVIGASMMLLVLGIGSVLAVGAVSTNAPGTAAASGEYTISCTPPAGRSPLNVACAVNPSDSATVVWTIDGADGAPPYTLAPGRHTIGARVLVNGRWIPTNKVEIVAG